MRNVEVSAKQVADLARQMAKSFGHDDPDMLVNYGPPLRIAAPHAFIRDGLYAVPSEPFPLYRIFEVAASEALAETGKLADVQFVFVNDERKAA